MCQPEQPSMIDESSGFGRLEAVAKHQDEWATMPISGKVQLLEQMLATMNEIGYEPHKELGMQAAKMMGIPTTTDEGRYESRIQALMFGATMKGQLQTLLDVFKIRSGESTKNKQLSDLETRKAINGQVCVKSFPLLTRDKFSANGHCTGEAWLDAGVKDETDVKPFSFEEIEQYEGGVMVILGAGNQGMLPVVDVLHGLFTKNCVVYLKHHQLRGYTDELIRTIFAPLIERGFFNTEKHTSIKRSSQLVHHPIVTNVHMTGGKATHDAIVWGTGEQGQENRLQNAPILKAKMTSELGAVSPWVVVPGEYSSKELEAQAKMLAFWIHNNASCNCNAPKVICVSEEWEQKDEFLGIVESCLAKHMLPVAYYPGIKSRWQSFRDQYPDAKIIQSNSGKGIQERQLSKPMFSDEATLLPYLQIRTTVDIASEEGRNAAMQEYAFSNEPFAPVYTIATLKNSASLESFCKTVSTFCNDYLFGSLSGSMTVAPAVESSKEVQGLVADLKYGSIGINEWAGINYSHFFGGWGAFPGESLDSVESGIGVVNNMLFLPNFEKCVMRAPAVAAAHPELKENLGKEASLIEALTKFILAPSPLSFMGVVSALVGVDVVSASLVGLGAVTIAIVGAYGFGRT